MTFSSTQWRSRFVWLGFAAAAHASLITLGLAMHSTASAIHTDIMTVSLLPVAPPAATPTPVKTQPAKTATPQKRLSEPTAITQAIAFAASDSPSSPSENQPSKAPTQIESAPVFVAAHDAAYLNNPRPIYPAMSRRLGEQGKVMLEVHVLPDGSANKVNLAKSSGYPRLDEAALESVRRWRFVPAKQGNDSVAQVVIIPMPFVLEK